MMNIAVACGGTGGHIFPGLATAQQMISRGHDVTLWLAGKDVEGEAVKDWPGNVITIPTQGFPSGFSLSSGVTAIKLVQAVRKVKADMIRNRPDVVLAMGSYASVGPVGAAIRLGIPFVLHEANVVPGRAVQLFSRWAAAIGVCFDETSYYLRSQKLVKTGMPLREELMEASSGRSPDGELVSILVMGGSRGAHALNEMATRVFERLHRAGSPFKVIHLAGERDVSAVTASYNRAGVSADVFAFTRNMGEIYAATDFAICRAGASTCAELSVFGIPSLLVPYPHAIRDHQTANAKAMEKAGAADMVPEKDITEEWLYSYIRQVLGNSSRRTSMGRAARERASGNGAGNLCDLMENVVRNSVPS